MTTLKYGGRTVAVLGVVLLLFVAYQLWGTSLQYARAQSGLRDDFSSLLLQTAAFRDGAADFSSPGGSSAEVASGTGGIVALSSNTATLSAGVAMLSPETAQLGATSSETETASGQAASDVLPPQSASSSSELSTSRAAASDTNLVGTGAEPEATGSTSSETSSAEDATETTTNEVAARKTLLVSPSTRLPRSEIENANLVYTPGAEEILPLLYPDNGNAVARIIIPAIKMDEIVAEGTNVDALRKGPGHYSWTPMPGQPGNASIAGHRTTYGAPFADIGNLRPNDKITVQTAQGEFVYEVLAQDLPTKGYLIVSPDRVDLLRDKGNNLLTLTSCHPRFSNRQRIVVQAKLIGNPVVPMRTATQSVPQELASEDLTGVSGADGAVAISGDAATSGDATQTGDVAQTGSAVRDAGAAGTGSAVRDAGAANASATNNAQTNTFSEDVASGNQALENQASENPTSENRAPENRASENQASSNQPASGAIQLPTSNPNNNPNTAVDTAVGTSFGSGLSGERSAIPSAVLWFVATATLWAVVWLIGTRWRRIPSVVIGILPVLGCLFVAFSYLDRALPSY